MTITRRELAKGTAWAAPVILATAAAPAMAASPCSAYRPGQPLPPSAFTITYLYLTNERFGDLASKQVYLHFGFKVSNEARSCGVAAGGISSYNNGGLSRATLTNGVSYNMSNGGSVPANGSVGVVDTNCDKGANATEACGTTGLSAYNVDGSAGTSAYAVRHVSIYRRIDIANYGPTVVYLNATIPTAGPFNHVGTNFSVSSRPLDG